MPKNKYTYKNGFCFMRCFQGISTQDGGAFVKWTLMALPMLVSVKDSYSTI